MYNWWGLGSDYAHNPAIGWMTLTFFVFAYFLFRFSKKPLAEFLQSRSKRIGQAIEEATLAKQDAQERLEQYEKRLLELDAEIKTIQANFAHQGELEKKRLEKEARQMAEQIAKESEESSKAYFERELTHLKQEAANWMIQTAKSKLQVTPLIEAGLFSQFVHQTRQV